MPIPPIPPRRVELRRGPPRVVRLDGRLLLLGMRPDLVPGAVLAVRGRSAGQSRYRPLIRVRVGEVVYSSTVKHRAARGSGTVEHVAVEFTEVPD